MASDKTEKATPKRKADARKKGQVAKSQDLNGAVVLLAALMALSAFGPGMVERLKADMTRTFALIATPDVIAARGLESIVLEVGRTAALAVAPVAITCLVVGVLVSVAQVGWKPSPAVLMPKPQKLNPIQGAKQIFGVNALFEGSKSVLKVAVVAVIVLAVLLPDLTNVAALVGMPPEELMRTLAEKILGIAQRAGAAYLVIAFADVAYQRWRHEKQMRMTKDEVKREGKDQNVSPEVRAAMKRRQMAAARARMMGDVPTADVVVTNPTHFAVALRYDGARHAAPVVVAKGQDLIALQIRRVAEEHGVEVVEEPPLARALHRSVEVGHPIPEELYGAVAAILAHVYRLAARRRLTG